MIDKQAPGGQHEEDLLADFRDVLGEDEAGATPPSEENSTDLDALDAFLNEFGQGGAAPDAADEVTDKTLAAEGSGAEPLAMDELNLDAIADEVDVPELNVSPDMDRDDLNLDEVEDMAPPEAPRRGASGDLFAAAVAPAAASAAAPVSIMAADDEPAAGGKTLDISTIGVALFSLVIAAVAGWFAVSLHGQMNDLRAELAQLRQQPAGVIAGPDRQMQENLAQLTQRVNEMAVLLDGPMSHLSDTSTQMNAVTARLDELEQRIGALRTELAAAARAAPQAAETPKAAKAEPPKTAAPAAQSVPKPAAASKPAGSGGWVVNVASLTDAKAAAAEQQRLQQAGFKVEVQNAEMNGRTWYRVRATGFSSREEAQVYADMVRHKMGVTPWVGIEK